MLKYDDVSSNEDSISNDIKDIIGLKNWDLIVTHNSNGEYGDREHKIISELVTRNVLNRSNLFYFGKYYTKNDISNYYNELVMLDEDDLNKKKDLMDIYDRDTMMSFNHIYMYENWVKYYD